MIPDKPRTTAELIEAGWSPTRPRGERCKQGHACCQPDPRPDSCHLHCRPVEGCACEERDLWAS